MELRKDYILNRYVVVSVVRGLRPNTFNQDIHPSSDHDGKEKCFFCPGNEYLTTKEKGRFGNPWKLRWFDNKFPALEPIGKYYLHTDNKYFTFSDAYGYHEVIAETNDHDKQLYDFSEAEIKDLLNVYRNRITELSAKEHIQYVLIFKNYGKDAGTSVKHTHSQVVALNHVPTLVQEKILVSKSYDSCPYCEIVAIEKNSFRRCFENSNFVAFAPYASRFNYEIWIFPKKHYASITQLNDYELMDLSAIMKQVVSRLKELNCSYNYYIHNSPEEYVKSNIPSSLHFHIEITPRIIIPGGFEYGTEAVINNISPEMAARFYRGEE